LRASYIYVRGEIKKREKGGKERKEGKEGHYGKKER